jgi:hypothetical protein
MSRGEKKSDFRNTDAEARLRSELEKLKRMFGAGYELELVWMPDSTSGLSGGVKDDTIYIYEVEEDRALQALRHEFVDYLLTSRLVKPLVELVNLLIKSRETEIYREKERVVEILCRMLG